MKNFLYFLLLTVSISQDMLSQNLISVHNGNSVSFFKNLGEAINSTSNGDTIFIPGGFWEIHTEITKSLHIIGAGHNPDSAKASLITIIQGNLIIEAGNGSICGVNITGGLYKNSNDSTNNYKVIRCRVDNGIHLNSFCSNWAFIENVVHGRMENQHGFLPATANCSFYNNIFDAGTNFRDFSSFTNCIFKNNLFLAGITGGNLYFPIFSTNSLYENNIFIGNSNNNPSVTYHSGNSIFNNNIFVENWGPSSCNCLGSNNFTNQSQSSIFINQNSDYFDFTHDYHLKPSCPGKNAGTDGQDIGIYGGPFPWKEGSLPANPHIEFKQISNNTDQNGNLKINLKVKAQNN